MQGKHAKDVLHPGNMKILNTLITFCELQMPFN